MLLSYTRALKAGWSPNTERAEASGEQLAAIDADSDVFVRSLVDLDATGPAIRLPDGSAGMRIPSYRKWIWDGEFCGSIGFRWLPGTAELPPHVFGHIGYSVVPWKRRRRYGSEALGLIVGEAREAGLEHVGIVTDPDNVGSQRVIEGNEGVPVERFAYPAAYGRADGLRYRITM